MMWQTPVVDVFRRKLLNLVGRSDCLQDFLHERITYRERAAWRRLRFDQTKCRKRQTICRSCSGCSDATVALIGRAPGVVEKKKKV